MKKLLFLGAFISMAASAQTVTDYVSVSGNPSGIAFDSQGTLYIGGESDYSVRKYPLDGAVTVLKSGMNGQPRQMTIDKSGKLWIAFWSLASIKSMDALTGNTVSYPASLPFGIAQSPVNNLIYFSESGSASKIYTYNDTTGEMTALPYAVTRPRGIVFDAAGNLYVANYSTAQIVKIDTAGNLTTVVDNVNYPAYLALDANNNLYISTESSGKIFKYNLSKTDKQAELFVQGLDYTNGLAVYNGNLYCAIVSKNKVVKITLDALATNDISANKFATIFPNPAENIITISTDTKVAKSEIYSTDGKLMMTRSNEKTMDISALPKGMYMLKADLDGQTKTFKFIKK